ncbi:MAG: beta-N-acetylhexosaminidase [Myxococcales bacterium]|jgi:beta-N-acetylhexosaminidase|nr:beta-N-acetylhexosaminidase [Myxococcales bacterium]
MKTLPILLALSLSASDTTAAPRAAQSCIELARANPSDFVAELCASMSLDEKISQMIMSYPPLAKTGPVTIGAVILLGPWLKSAEVIQAKTADLQARAKIPLLTAVDMEGGQLNRLQIVPALKSAPSGRTLGQMSPENAEGWGKTLGVQMRALGLNCNLGPVLDLADSGHMFERERSMGSDAKRVAEVAAAYVRGMRSEGVIGIGKHFPGYGAVAENSDRDFVLIDRSPEEMQRHTDPFFTLGKELGGVLLTNIAFKAQGGQPAILSPDLVTLAHDRERDWVTMTDDLAVAPLRQATGGDAEEVVRRAFHAGNDILLTTAPIDWDKAIDLPGIVKREVERVPALTRRVDASVLRILRLKERMGLLDDLKRQKKEQRPPTRTTATPPPPTAAVTPE